MSKNFVVVLAGGEGFRHGSDIPKQFRVLDGLPILMHTIQVFHKSSLDLDILLVLNKKFISYWNSLCEKYNFHVPLTIIEGGTERFYSSQNAIKYLEVNGTADDAIIGIHDGVRPFINETLLSSLYENAVDKKAVVPGQKCINPVREQVFQENLSSLDRSLVYIVQTPQVFTFKTLRDAYKQQTYMPGFYDDAMVVEANGTYVNVIEGLYENIKITYALDLYLAEAIMNFNKEKQITSGVENLYH